MHPMKASNGPDSLTLLFVLRYPNGRGHERAIRVQRAPSAREEITLVGRRWRVGHILPADRRNAVPRVVCTPIDAVSPLETTRYLAESAF